MKNPEAAFHPKDFRAVLEAVGLNPASVSPQVTVMKKAGDIKATGTPGEYRVTPQGARHFGKIIKEREARHASKGK
jgi:DNA-binding IclR family transcriptional regulator